MKSDNTSHRNRNSFTKSIISTAVSVLPVILMIGIIGGFSLLGPLYAIVAGVVIVAARRFHLHRQSPYDQTVSKPSINKPAQAQAQKHNFKAHDALIAHIILKPTAVKELTDIFNLPNSNITWEIAMEYIYNSAYVIKEENTRHQVIDIILKAAFNDILTPLSQEAKQLVQKAFDNSAACSRLIEVIKQDPNIQQQIKIHPTGISNPLYYGEKLLILDYLKNQDKIPELHKQLFPQEEPDLPKTSPSITSGTAKSTDNNLQK